MSATPQNLLSINDLHVHYGKSHVLHGVNLNIGHNEVVSLLGRNGAGRSTTMKAVMGLVPASAGSIQTPGATIGSTVAHIKIHINERIVSFGNGRSPASRAE